MRPGPSACALFGLVLLACSRTDRATASGSANDAGEAPDAASARTVPSVHEASVPDAFAPESTEVWDAACGIADAGNVAQDGAYGMAGWACTIPSQARSSAACQVNPYPGNVPPHCRLSEYELVCSGALNVSALDCNLIAIEEAPVRGYDYCCSCEGTDAATGCVNVDPSDYDRSCTRASDCVFIWAGMSCPGGCTYVCGLGNAAINVESQACYDRAIAPLKAGSLDTVCHCPANYSGEPGPVCVQGVCTVPNQQ
jgi:hypothetical protein